MTYRPQHMKQQDPEDNYSALHFIEESKKRRAESANPDYEGKHFHQPQHLQAAPTTTEPEAERSSLSPRQFVHSLGQGFSDVQPWIARHQIFRGPGGLGHAVAYTLGVSPLNTRPGEQMHQSQLELVRRIEAQRRIARVLGPNAYSFDDRHH